MTQTMKAWFTVPGPEGAVFELRETQAPARGSREIRTLRLRDREQ